MAVDSAAAFKERYCDDKIQLGAHVARFEAAGWFTFADLVFSTTFTPQNGMEERYNDDIVMKGLGDLSHRDCTKLRRLFFEAYTMVGASLRQTVESPSGSAPREIPNAELESRRERTAARFPGVPLENELDVADRLLIRAIEVYDSNKIAYIGLDLCTKRDDAVVGVQKNSEWESAPNVRGGFTFSRPDDGRRVNLDGQFKFAFAMQRRSLAMDMAEIMSYQNSERLRGRLIAALMLEPPPGFLPIGFQQALDADRCFWVEMAKVTRKGIKLNSSARPCDTEFQKVYENFTFNMTLMPRQGSVRMGQSPPAALHDKVAPPQLALHDRVTPPAGGGGKRQRRQAAAAANQNAGASSSNNSKAAKDLAAANAIANAFKRPKTEKGAGRDNKERPVRLPPKLIGMCTSSSRATGSKKFCFSYNLDGCDGAAAGASCPKGLHACMQPLPNGEACSGNHTTFSCRR